MSTGDHQPIPGYIDTSEAARILGRHPDTVLRLARQGKIPGAVFIQGYLFPEGLREQDIQYARRGRPKSGKE